RAVERDVCLVVLHAVADNAPGVRLDHLGDRLHRLESAVGELLEDKTVVALPGRRGRDARSGVLLLKVRKLRLVLVVFEGDVDINLALNLLELLLDLLSLLRRPVLQVSLGRDALRNLQNSIRQLLGLFGVRPHLLRGLNKSLALIPERVRELPNVAGRLKVSVSLIPRGLRSEERRVGKEC